MSDGSISIKLAPQADMHSVQQNLDAEQQNEGVISNDGFFPDMSLQEFRYETRTDGTITEPRLRDVLIEAMASVNDELAEFKQQNAEYEQLSQVPSSVINGESILLYRYKRAVKCLALANLYERYASYDTTNDGEKKMELLKASIDELRRDTRFAIADILKKNRINVALI